MTIATRGQGLSGEPPDSTSTSQVRLTISINFVKNPIRKHIAINNIT